MKEQVQSKSPLETEQYKQACDDHRFYGDMRFKQLSLFAVISGLLLNALKDITVDEKVSTVSSIGMMITCVIWIMEVSSSMHGQRARARKRSFEEESVIMSTQEVSLSTEKAPEKFEPKWTHLNATNAVLLLYMVSYLSWFILFLWFAHSYLLRAIGLMLGMMYFLLIIFSLREYGPLFSHGHRKWRW